MTTEALCQPECEDHHLERVEHPENREDWDGPHSRQGYRVMRCRACGAYWGVRYQWDAGTGRDDRYHRFGHVDPDTIKRHY